MTEKFEGTVRVLTDFAIGRSPDRPDILVLTIRSGDLDLPVALDRRLAMRMGKELARIAAKLTAPKHEQ